MIPKAISMDLRQIASLLVFFTFYVIFGGTVFMYLEAPLENQKRQEIEEVLIEFRDKLQMINHPNITQEHITDMIQKLLVAQDMNLVDRYGNKTEFINWSFFNSFFFAITVTTTIGYGHLTPYTVLGKIFCIYALFGIPMTGLLIGGIGHRFSMCFSRNISKARSRYQRQMSIRLMMLKKGLIFFVPWFIVFLVLPAIVFAHIENWTFLEGFYYCFVTLSTIGFGDYVAGSFEKNYIWVYKLIVVLWIIFGLAYLSMILNFISQGLRSQRLTDVVQSIRRISGPQFNYRFNHLSRLRRNNKYNRQQSVPIALLTHNGKIIKSEMSLNSATPSLSSPSPTYSQQQSFNDSFDTSGRPEETHFFHILNIFPYFKNSSRNTKTKAGYDKPENFLTISTSPRRTSSLPDIIEHRLAGIDESDLDAVDSEPNTIDYNRSDNCIVSMVSSETDPSISANNLSVKESLIEKRKMFFVDMNSNPRLQVTPV